MASQVMRITLKAYDHQLVDASARKIIETVKKNGSKVSGPVPLPTKKEVVTILRAVHKYGEFCQYLFKIFLFFLQQFRHMAPQA